ncbi:SDR family NAD(P)-dependent oxidoreductase [Bacteroides stercoris]|uniref:SDR family NAD(P)-dependent oxidoreductase n=5 Tax=Bacteroides stercoris TaxID=46506 RepID=A0A415PZN3_BACSE|nr:SDR family NAD(P)-dependent oxidoreductase [Bacteroides stercoris]MBV3491884.1 SDR family NAD(P)-dependent oxidoreductase [Bacteroides stercoris]MBV3633037.1 SDR family NAD(P)-dependent oxidoreductase [Bacteroides stercoris]MBV3676892.1 SDR family NAD(P)-dependent oxidoreductase [Bacteroides stercoris]RGL93863.1 SDR family NAD(P)-dependent oxidoreductase [Bacteroides stercoris]
MNEQFSITGKVAVITDAGGVLGGNIAKCFMQQGAKVVAVDIRQEQLDKRVEELKTYGEDVIGIVGNVPDIASLEKLWIVPRWLSKVKAASPTSPNTHATYPYPNISKSGKILLIKQQVM